MNTTAKITGVFTETGENAKGEWTRYDVRTDDKGKYQTFNHQIGKKAEALKGQEVILTYQEVTRGQYTNNVLEGVDPVNDVTASASRAQAAQAEAQASQDEFRRSKEEMRRTEAVKAAATLIASPNWLGETDIETLGVLADEISALIEHGAPVF